MVASSVLPYLGVYPPPFAVVKGHPLPSCVVLARASYAGSGAVAEGIAQVVPPAPGTPRAWEGLGEWELDGTVTAVAIPRNGVRHEAGLEVQVEGSAIPRAELMGALAVDRSLDRALQTWQFSMPFAAAAARFGSPWERVGPSIGKRALAFYGVYRTSTGVHRFPLLTPDGLVDNEQDSAGPSEGNIAFFSGVDGMGRLDKRAVTKKIPPGSGLPRGRVIQILTAEAGETRFRLEDGGRMDKEVQAVNTSAVRLSQEILDAEGRRLLKDREGFLINPQPGRRGNKPIKATLEPRDLLAIAQIEATHPGAVLTDVTLTGTKQITKPPEVAAGREVKVQEIEIFAIYAPGRASFVQNGNCSLSAQAGPGAAALQLVQLIRTITETQAGVVIAETEEVWGHKWAETSRYTWNAGVASCRTPVYLAAGASAEGSEPAFAIDSERWELLTRNITRHYYDKPGFPGGPTEAPSPEVPWAQAYSVNLIQPTGFRLGSIRESYGWGFPKCRIKSRGATTTPWEDIDIDDVETTGAGDGVRITDPPDSTGTRTERFLLLSKEYEVIDAERDTGAIKSETVYRQAYALRSGSSYLYNDGRESSQERETFQLAGWTITAYVRQNESQTKQIQAVYEFDGQAKQMAGRVETLAGAGPVVDRISDPEDLEGLFESEDEAAGAVTASPTEGEPIKVRVFAPDLELNHEKGEVNTSVPWAETVEELAALAALLILHAAASQVGFVTPANFQLAEGDWIHLRYPPLLLDHDVELQSVRYSVDSPGGPCLTTFSAAVYPEVTE